MKTISLKVPPALHAKLQKLARERKSTQSALARQAIEAYLFSQRQPRPGSLLDRMKDVVGCFEGPGDLSTNPKYMEGFGQ